MGEPLRIALVLSSLGCGGAERVATLLARELAARGRRLSLVTLERHTPDFHGMPTGVERIALAGPGPSHSLPHALRNNVAALAQLARALRSLRPQVALSFGDTTNVKTLLAAAPARIPTVVSERVDPRTIEIGRSWSALRKLAYRRAAALVVQTERVRPWAERMIAPARVEVIGNPVEPAPLPMPPLRGHEIVAVGRLVPQKGFDVLLRAFARVAPAHPRWRLTLLGEGPSRPELLALAAALGLAERVALPGQVHEVRARLRTAALFVLASRFEGFPNALLEAMAEGAAIVATDCPSGPAEILKDCDDAIIVPPDDEGALAEALAQMLADPQRREACGAAVQRAAARFAPAAIVDRWELVLARAAAG